MMKDEKKKKEKNFGQHLVSASRFVIMLPIIGLFVAAVALTITTLYETISTTVLAIINSYELSVMLVNYIEYADFFLLAVVLFIMSIGLYTLFINDEVRLPRWLEIHTLDDLKEKLVSVIVVVMGVFFLGCLLNGAKSLDLLYMGVGIAAVVIGLSYFVSRVMFSHGSTVEDDEEDEDDEEEGTENKDIIEQIEDKAKRL